MAVEATKNAPASTQIMRNRNVFNIFNLLAETAGVPWSADTDKQRYRLTRVKEARPHRFGGSYTMKMRHCQLAALRVESVWQHETAGDDLRGGTGH